MLRLFFAACVLFLSGLLAVVGRRGEAGEHAALVLNVGLRPPQCPAAGWGFMCASCGLGAGAMTAQQMWTSKRHFDRMKLVWIRQIEIGDTFCRVLAYTVVYGDRTPKKAGFSKEGTFGQSF